MKVMTEAEIPAFVTEILAIGCEICAAGSRHYCMGDADLSPEKYQAIAPKLLRIIEAYGYRDHLQLQITAHLRSIGRHLDAEDMVGD